MLVSNCNSKSKCALGQRKFLRRGKREWKPADARAVVPQFEYGLITRLLDYAPGIDPALAMERGDLVNDGVERPEAPFEIEPAVEAVEPRHTRIVRRLTRVLLDGREPRRRPQHVFAAMRKRKHRAAKFRAKLSTPDVVFDPQ